jgi:proton-coupled amino acid transporter
MAKPHTYSEGEDAGRLASAARSFGLNWREQARKLQPMQNVAGLLFHDSTLEAAMMHSVGTIGRNERVDGSGTLHLLTLERREKHQVTTTAPRDYGTLGDLFHKKPLQSSDEEEEEEVIVEDVVEGGSLTAAVFGIIKGTVGPAILYLPRGFQLSGYAVAIPAMMFATLSYLYSAHRLLECWKVESERNRLWGARMEEVRALLLPASAAETGATTSTDKEEEIFTPKLLSYPELGRRAFGSNAFVIELGIALMQFGVCLTYLIFVPQNLYESIRALFGLEVPKLYFLLAMLLIEIPLSWIQDIRKLTTTNIIATLLIAYGLVSCLIIALTYSYGTKEDASSLFQSITSLPPLHDTWILFIGTSFFVFEGSITLLVPLQEAVFRKEDKDKFPSVNRTATLWIVAFYIFFAIVCWASFGDRVRTALTASLPGGSFSTSVQLAYSIAVIFTFPLQAFPALEVACHSITSDQKKKDRTLKRNSLATVLICALGLIAIIAIDYLGNVVSLLGSLVGIPIALIYPPLMHNKLVKNNSKATQLMNCAVAFIGFLAMGATSCTTIAFWNKGAEE